MWGGVSHSAFIKEFYHNSAFRFMVAFRLQHSNGMEKLIGKTLWRLVDKKIYDIPLSTEIGYGFYIGHRAPVVINGTARIGNNVNISPFLVIGSNHDSAAEIGDNVYIGPNVSIVENVKIGNNCTIGAGSVVTKDIPDNATAAGNYAKVLNYNDPGRYINNKWKVI